MPAKSVVAAAYDGPVATGCRCAPRVCATYSPSVARPVTDGIDTAASSFGVCTVNSASFSSTASTYGIFGVASDATFFTAGVDSSRSTAASPCSSCTEYDASAASSDGPAWNACSVADAVAGDWTDAAEIVAR